MRRVSLLLLLAFVCLPPLLAADWLPGIGGSLDGGVALCVASDRADPSLVYAGTWAGLYRSANGGAEWSLVDLPFADPVFSLAWDPVQHRLFAGGSGRIFVSDESGLSWSTLQLPTDGGFPVTAILIDPVRLKIYAGTAGQGLFVSGDGGANWFAPQPQPVDVNRGGVFEVRDLALDPSDGTVLVATSGALFSFGRFGGTSLDRVDTGAVSALAFGPGNSRFYVDERKSVAPVPQSGSWSLRTEFTGTDPARNSLLDLCFDPHDPTLLWAGAESGLYKGRLQADGSPGIAWTKVEQVPDAVGAIACEGGEAARVLAGGMSGVWISADAGQNWQNSSAGIRASRFVDLIRAPGGSATLFGVTLDSFVYTGGRARVLRSNDWAASWQLSLEIPDYPPPPERPTLAFGPGLAPVTLYLDGRWASPDAGETWATDLPFVMSPGEVESFYVDPANPDNQALSAGYVWSSPGFPLPLNIIWTQVTRDGWLTKSNNRGISGDLLRIDPHSSNFLYMNYYTGRINREEFFQTHTSSLACPLKGVEDFDPDRSVPGKLYVVHDRRLYVHPGSNDQPQLSGLPANLGVLAVRSHLTRPGVVAAGTTEGVWVSGNYGATWEKLEFRGLSLGSVFGFRFVPTDPSAVYVAAARGAFRLPLPGRNLEQRRRLARPGD